MTALRIRRPEAPYALPPLFNGDAISGDNLERYCRSTIRAAWAAGSHAAGVKAAREHIAQCRLTRAGIAALARALTDYNNRAWPSRTTAQKLDWLYKGAGCCERHGTEYDAHVSAWPAISAALSIIVEAPPLEHVEDADALLSTLVYTGWRHVPRHQQAGAAKRMARFVSDSLLERATWRGRNVLAMWLVVDHFSGDGGSRRWHPRAALTVQ